MKIITRTEWHARKVTRFVYNGALDKVYIHHTAGYKPNSVPSEIIQMQTLQHIAIDINGDTDLPYNWVIGPSGTVFEGRGLGYRSAATKDENLVSRSICVMGNYELQEPSVDTINAIADLIEFLIDEGDLKKTCLVLGHKDNPQHKGATSCPGKNLYQFVPFLRSKPNPVGDEMILQNKESGPYGQTNPNGTGVSKFWLQDDGKIHAMTGTEWKLRGSGVGISLTNAELDELS